MEESATHSLPEELLGDKRDSYLPEPAHWFDQGVVPFNVAEHVTLTTVAHWADRYEVSSPGFSVTHQAGGLPPNPLARTAFLEEMITSLAVLPEARISLFQGDQPLLEQSNGVPGVLKATVAEFAALQEAWKQRGLPFDLYYPAEEQHTPVEPVTRFGGVVRVSRRYSPRRLAAHTRVPSESVTFPNEATRQRAFEREWLRFHKAVLLRIDELSEPGRYQTPQDRAEIEALRRLITLLHS